MTVDADKVATVECAASLVELSVLKQGTGGCTVTSNLPGIDCGGTCKGNFPLSTIVRLTAAPDADSIFAGWGGACTGTGFCDVTLDQAKSVTATCSNVPVHTLSVLKSGAGGGTVVSSPEGIDCGGTCSKAFIEGTQVTLNATPDARSVFVGWGGACTGTGPCRVTMTEARAVVATFSDLASTLTIVKFGTGECVVQSSPEGIDCGGSCSTRFLTGTPIRLVAAPAAQSTFAGWGGACTGTGACNVTLDTDKAVTATCTANPAFVLTVIPAGTGVGVVTSDPAGINCGGACASAFPAGTAVTLNATPNAFSTFVGWGGPCTGTGTCTVTMNEAKAVTATFLDVTQPLTVVKAGTGQGAVISAPLGIDCGGTCTAKFLTGTRVRLVATPGPESIFDGWRGACTGTDACFVTLDAAKSVTAVFTDVTSTLTVALTGAGSGTVTSTPAGVSCSAPSCATKFVTGSVIRLSATPDADSIFAGWQGACTGTGTCTVTLTGNLLVTAVFVPTANTLSVLKSGTGTCTVTSSPAGIDCGGTCSASYPTGTVVRLRVTPEAGSTFVRWGGACEAANATYTISAAANPIGGGTVTCTPSPVPQGGNASCTVTTNAGYTFSGFAGDCTGLTCSLTNVTANKSVTANFTLNTYAITATANPVAGGTVSCTPNPVSHGGTSTCSVTTNPGYIFSGFSGACSGTTCILANVTGARAVTANFAVISVPTAAITPSSLTFAGQPVGAPSAALAVTVANSGGGSLVLSSATSNNPQFAVSQACGSLSAGQSCSISVVFTPTTLGAKSGALTIQTNGGNASISMSGSGVASASFSANVNAVVTGYYESILGRSPDAAGLAFWSNEAGRTVLLGADVRESFYTMAMQFFSSAEYTQRGTSNEQYIRDLYQTFYARQPDASGLGYWLVELAAINSRSALLNSFLFSPEYSSTLSSLFGNAGVRPEVNLTMDFFRGAVGRLPDDLGFVYWRDQLRAAQCQGGNAVNTKVAEVGSLFFGGAEYSQRARIDRDFVGDVYNTYLRRGPGGDSAGFNFWVTQTGLTTRDAVRNQFIPSAEFQSRVRAIVAAGCALP